MPPGRFRPRLAAVTVDWAGISHQPDTVTDCCNRGTALLTQRHVHYVERTSKRLRAILPPYQRGCVHWPPLRQCVTVDSDSESPAAGGGEASCVCHPPNPTTCSSGQQIAHSNNAERDGCKSAWAGFHMPYARVHADALMRAVQHVRTHTQTVAHPDFKTIVALLRAKQRNRH